MGHGIAFQHFVRAVDESLGLCVPLLLLSNEQLPLLERNNKVSTMNDRLKRRSAAYKLPRSELFLMYNAHGSYQAKEPTFAKPRCRHAAQTISGHFSAIRMHGGT